MRGWVPGHSVRVELGKAGLSFYPGCERALFPQSAGPGIYKGECADGQMMQVTVPPAFEAMPLFPRQVGARSVADRSRSRLPLPEAGTVS